MLRCMNISKFLGLRCIFKDLSFTVSPGDRIGVVGANGAGKSTLLKILSSEMEIDKGSIEKDSSLSLAYLRQEFADELDCDLLSFVHPRLAAAGAKKVELELQLQLNRCRVKTESLLADYSQALEQYELCGGYDFEAKLESQLAGLGLDQPKLDRHIQSLSGGQRIRLALLRILLEEADLILLDEPTNNLDCSSMEWLEDQLMTGERTYVLVSHDRRFLDRVTNRTFEIDPLLCGIRSYSGNYSFYKQRQAEETARQWRQFNEQERKIARLMDDIREVKEQAARTENSTVNDYLRGRAKKVAAKAKAREVRLTRIIEKERIEKPRQDLEPMRLKLEGKKLYDSAIIRARQLSYCRNGTPFFENLDLNVQGSARVVLSGNNGSGKTTVLHLLMGSLPRSDGELFVKEGISIAYLSQERDEIPLNSTVLAFMQEQVFRTKKSITDTDLRTFLHRFQFANDDAYKKIGQLSMGERSKLCFASFVAAEPDLLILDEPTNHIDLASIECLEQVLRSYRGAFIVVSHDRYFIDSIDANIFWHIKVDAQTGKRNVEIELRERR